MYRGGQLRDISEVCEAGVTIIQQFRHLGPFTHALSYSPSVDHGLLIIGVPGSNPSGAPFVHLEMGDVKELSSRQTEILPSIGGPPRQLKVLRTTAHAPGYQRYFRLMVLSTAGGTLDNWR